MEERKVSMLALGAIILVSGLSQLTALGADYASVQMNTSSPTLTVGLTPGEDVQSLLNAFEPVQKYLESELGMKVQTFAAANYTAVIDAMQSKKVDVAYLGPFSYLLAAQRANAEAIVAGGTADGKVGSYYSYIVANENSGLKSADDLKKNVSKISFAWSDPASTSGYLVPREYLMSLGIKPEQDFKESTFAGSFDLAMLAVKSGKADAGTTNDAAFNSMIERGVIKPDEVVVLWKSDPIPSSPIAVRGDLDPGLKKKIQQAFLDLPKKDPEAFKSIEARWENSTSYVPISDTVYEPIRVMAKAQGYI